MRAWFDTTLKRGDGTPAALRSGNEVRELIDGREALAAMAEAIKTASAEVKDPETARPTLFVLRHFGTAPDDPIWAKEQGLIAEGADGSLYSTSPAGGKNLRGAAFKITPDGKTLTILHHFEFATGVGPSGGLTRGRDGAFYGTTYEGGKYGTGTIFRIGADGGHSVLWDFRNGRIVPPLPYPQQPTEQQKLDAAGSYPASPPVVGPDGGLVGVTGYANNQQYGVLYSGTLTGRYFFQGPNGRYPTSLVAGRDGSLYGTTIKGDATCPLGTVFKASGSGGGVSAIHKFDVARGYGAVTVMQASDGNLYGTTSAGGPTTMGVIYRLTPGGTYTILRAFNGTTDGASPVAGLAEGKDGNLYGITYQGGTFDKGVLYRIEVPRFVYLLGWWLTDSVPLVAGDAASTLAALTADASKKGVPVRGMFSDHLTSHPTDGIDRMNALDNGAAIHDDRHLNGGSHHQKLLVVSGASGLIAFLGGVDINPDRVETVKAGAGEPLHDVHCRVRGPAAGDLLDVFTARWNDHPGHADPDKTKGALKVTAEVAQVDPIPGATHWVQVARTYGNSKKYTLNVVTAGTPYAFAPYGEQSAARMILKGIQQAKTFIYVEDQYFVDTAPNAANLDVRAALIATLKKPTFQHLTVVIPHGSISDLPQVNYRRQHFIKALRQAAPAKVRVFARRPVGGPHSYVHAKTWVFDDQYAIVGSVNTNRRSWTHDSEVAVGICDQGSEDGSRDWLPRRLRMRLWLEHLGMEDTAANRAKVRDAVASAALWLTEDAKKTIWPYDENVGIDLVNPDTTWNQYDPDGS